jgi:hypothetical protein
MPRKFTEAAIGLDRVLGNAEWLNRVLIAGGIFLASLLILKMTKSTEFKWNDAKVPLDLAWVVVLLFSIAHHYTAAQFFDSLYDYRKNHLLSDSRALFERLTTTGGVCFRGLRSRSLSSNKRFYLMHADDLTTWIFLGLAGLAFVVCLPFHAVVLRGWLIYVAIAIYLLIWNWIVGSKWSIALGELRVSREDTYYYQRAETLRKPFDPVPVSGVPFMGLLQLIPRLVIATKVGFFGAVGVCLIILYVVYARSATTM